MPRRAHHRNGLAAERELVPVMQNDVGGRMPRIPRKKLQVQALCRVAEKISVAFMDADLCAERAPRVHKENVVKMTVRQKHIFQLPAVTEVRLRRHRIHAWVNNGKFLCRILQNQIGIGSVTGAFQTDDAHKTPHNV